MKRIVFTGGGTAGHVTPNLPLIAHYQTQHWEVHYIGSGANIELDLINPTGATYHRIKSGKLRRYLTLRTLVDAVKVLIGIAQAFVLLRRLRPAVVFSKGGYVAFPVVLAGWLNRIPVVIHESDLSPGLANRMSFPLARKICVTFAETCVSLPPAKTIHTGAPVRTQLLTGNAEQGLRFCNLDGRLPLLLIIGGSQGARLINEVVRAALTELLSAFQVVHLCGAGNIALELEERSGYRQFEFVGAELGDVLAATTLVISRAGAGSLLELLSLKLPHLLVPLGTQGSRGDQLENAALAERHGWSLVLQESCLKPDALVQKISELFTQREQFRTSMASFPQADAVSAIAGVIDSLDAAGQAFADTE